MGASDVLVGGNLYDVQFLDGTCADLYSGCDAVSDFTFQTQASATLASQALLDQVFLDATGLFDSQPELTRGCGALIECGASTPFLVPGGSSSWVNGMVRARNRVPHYPGNPGLTYTDEIVFPKSHWDGYNTGADNRYVYAVWSPVPEPSTALLLGLGLTGLAAQGRRRNRS